MKTAEQLLIALAEADNKVATRTGELKQAKEEYEALASQVMGLLDEQGLSEMGAPKASLSVSIGETVGYGFDDFDAFTRFLLRNKALHLMYRRLSSKAVEDMMATRNGKAIPGVKPYKIRRLHVSTMKGAK